MSSCSVGQSDGLWRHEQKLPTLTWFPLPHPGMTNTGWDYVCASVAFFNYLISRYKFKTQASENVEDFLAFLGTTRAITEGVERSPVKSCLVMLMPTLLIPWLCGGCIQLQRVTLVINWPQSQLITVESYGCFTLGGNRRPLFKPQSWAVR